MNRERQTVTGVILEDETRLSLGELSQACCVNAEFIVELVQEGIVEPEDPASRRWVFSGVSLIRTRKAINLRRDLGINLAGIALALELLEERERLMAQIERARPHL